jgi:hypothetical protein
MKKIAVPVKKTELTAVGIRCADHATPSIRKSRHVSHMAKKNIYRLLAGKSEGRMPLGRRRCRWEYNNKYLKDTDRVGECGLCSFRLEQRSVAGCFQRTYECKI